MKGFFSEPAVAPIATDEALKGSSLIPGCSKGEELDEAAAAAAKAAAGGKTLGMPGNTVG